MQSAFTRPGRQGQRGTLPALFLLAAASVWPALAQAQTSVTSTDTNPAVVDAPSLLQRMSKTRPALYIEPTGPTQSIQYADGQPMVYDTETRWRAMCGSSPLTEEQLKMNAEVHKAKMADQANILVIDTPHSGASTRGAGLNVVFNINTSGMPSGAAASFVTAENYIESKFSDPITITISVSWANLGGGVIGQTGSSYVNSVSYNNSRNGLINGQDANDTIQDFLPTTSTLPVRYDASSATVTNETVVFWTRANYKSTVGTSSGADADMTYNSAFSFDFDPSNGVGGSLLSLVDTVVHEVGHGMGFTSGADFRTNDLETIDLFRFARIDRPAVGDTNPDTTAEFQTTAREVDFNNPTNDDVISDIISAEYRMSDGNPNQASHFYDQGSAIGIMDPTLSNGQTFYPEFFRASDINMFDAIGWNDGVCPLPEISVQPVGASLCFGSPINLSVTAANGSLTYQWRRNSTNIAGATGPSYSDASASAGDAGNYDVVITNSCGSTTSNDAVITVDSAASISVQPVSVQRCVGTSAVFSVVASGATSYTYQWRKNTVNIGGATGPSYTVPSVDASDVGNYSVVVSSGCGGITSSDAALTIIEGVGVTAQPQSQVVCTGYPLNLSISASGNSPSFRWQKNGLDIPGATSSSFSIPSVTVSDAGEYACIVENICANDISNPAFITVNATPSFSTNPASQTKCVGNSVTFTAVASGSPAPTLQWRKGGVNISGATGSSYTIPSVDANSAGTYDVVATNSCSSVPSSGAVLTVNDVPAFSLQPSNQAACEGAPFSFTVAATSSVAYQWRKNTANISGANGPTYSGTATLADAATYDCVLTNSCGSSTSSPVTLAVNTGPAVTTQPTGDVVASGAAASLSIVATGTGPLSYQWRLNAVNLSDTGPYTGSSTANLNIATVTAAEEGDYDVVVTNPCGSTTSNVATILLAIGCASDLDDGSGTGTPDGGVDINDLLFFLSSFEAGSTAADLDNGSSTGTPDGGVDINDLLFFLARFEAGC